MLRRRSLAVLAIICLAVNFQAFAADESAKPFKVAHIKLAGDLGEQPAGADPLFGTASENLKTKMDRIQRAKNDANIKALYLEVGSVSAGLGKAHELRKIISDFRKAGKKVYCYLEASDGGGGNRDYLIATACDEIAMCESATVGLVGIRFELSFYKDLFDKLGIKADMMQMGDFKGAGETYTRNSASKENRMQWDAIAEGQYEYMVECIAQSRQHKGFTPDKVRKLIDQGPFTARTALKVGLVDRLCYADDYKEMIKKDLKAEKLDVVKNYGKPKAAEFDMSNPFAIFKLLQTPKEPKISAKPKVAVIYASGQIMTGKSGMSFLGGETMGSTTMIEAIRKAEQEPTVKAIVLRIDSPGGSALASDLIWNELNRSKKPVIASMSDIAGSGGYYIACMANKIYAEPGTITGSIGVVGGKIVLGGLYDKFGIKTEVISRGANSGALSSSTPFTDGERKAMKAMMQEIYDQFLDRVVAGRKKAGKEFKREELVKLAGGRIWTGRQAKANGLIDEIGTLEDAVAAAKEKAGLKDQSDVELFVLPKGGSMLDGLLDRFGGGGDADTTTRLLKDVMVPLPEMAAHLRAAEAVLRLRGEHVWTMIPYRIEVK